MKRNSNCPEGREQEGKQVALAVNRPGIAVGQPSSTLAPTTRATRAVCEARPH
jgi:hypothetical protein